MDTKKSPTPVTGTGIAVGIAVVVAVVLLFFGQKIFSLFTTSNALSSEQLTATTTMETTSTGDQTNSASDSMQPQTVANPTQLETKDIVVGTGAEAKAGDTVTVQYVGKLTNGTVFDASLNHGTDGFSFNLGGGQVIKGWDEGVAGMKVGGKRELIIPASLGYGAQAVGSIPANSTLIFEVDLIGIK
jgi:peptidylprolyl isomerase